MEHQNNRRNRPPMGIQSPENQTPKDMTALFSIPENQQKMEKIGRFLRTLKNEKQWEKAHVQAESVIKDLHGHILEYYFAQQIAIEMLWSVLLPQNNNPEVQKTLGFYMEVLMKYNNYRNKVLFAAVLPRLEGYWTAAKIQTIAGQCLDSDFLKKSGKTYLVYNPSTMSNEDKINHAEKILRERLKDWPADQKEQMIQVYLQNMRRSQQGQSQQPFVPKTEADKKFFKAIQNKEPIRVTMNYKTPIQGLTGESPQDIEILQKLAGRNTDNR